MNVDPYRRPPIAPTVALLDLDLWRRQHAVLDEHGAMHRLERLPEHTRVWCSYDTARALVTAGDGEALCWRGEETRWRHRTFEEGWRRRPSDVHVLKLPLPADDPQAVLRGLAGWRDWLVSHGAAPVGTSGSSAWSLLRAKLDRTLFCTVGDPPPLRETLGGRQELGPHGVGEFRGRIVNVDLRAAYALELGRTPYGGRWYRRGDLPGSRSLEAWAHEHRPVFVRAKVRVPADMCPGPLPRRPRSRQDVPELGDMALLAKLLLENNRASYPSGVRMQGVWCFQELQQAERAGATVERILDAWVHVGGLSVFEPWWQAIVEGRALPGWAGVLAKVTGNALWGRFCMDARSAGERTIKSGGVSRVLPRGGGSRPAHDLAETVSGRTRARLYELMLLAGDRLLSAHTDGAWCLDPGRRLTGELPEGWRAKQRADRLDLWDPQVLRYWRGGEATTVFSGQPASMADRAFEELWERREEMAA